MTLSKYAALTLLLACGDVTNPAAESEVFDVTGSTPEDGTSLGPRDDVAAPADVAEPEDASLEDTAGEVAPPTDTTTVDDTPNTDAAPIHDVEADGTDPDAPTDVNEPDVPVSADTESLETLDPDTGSDTESDTESDTWAAPDPFSSPILIASLPAVVTGDTTTSPSLAIDSYACAPNTDESGPEVVYRLDVPSAGTLTLALDDVSGDAVDVDVHVLDAPDPGACFGRADKTLSVSVAAGPLWIVVDTWVQNGAPKPGPYTLSISLGAPDPCGPSSCLASDLGTPNGIPVEPAGLGGCPDGMTRVDSFCIDRWEAALVATTPETPVTPYAAPNVAVRAVSAPGLVPSGYVSGVVAAAACVASGKRLCTDSEWLRACQGPTGTTYPYGAAISPGTCNDARACHPAVQYFGTSAAWIWSELDHPCLNQLPESLALTGAHPGCVSAEGAFDLVGNLHEWTADPAGTFRGGFYVDTKINGPGCLYKTTAHDVSHFDYSTGFRCCADAP